MSLNFFLYFAGCVVFALSAEKQNYYWQNFDGNIPANAIPAGKGIQGVAQYVGKTNKYGKEIPGTIGPGYGDNSNALRIVHNKIRTTVKDNVKILCADYPEQMQWITINAETFRQIWHENIVMGGSYDTSHGDFPYLVGRKTFNNRVIIGGVTTSEFEMSLIAVDTEGVTYVNVGDGIELLTFNPYLPKKDSSQSLKPGSGYFWEDYKGFIPEHAVPAGVARDGTTTYIGQTYFNRTLACGELDQVTKSLHFVYNNAPYQVPINIKILCAHHLEQMEWVEVTTKDLWFQWQKDIVAGGFNGLYPLLVGRKSYQGRTVVGAGITYGWTVGFYFYNEGSSKFLEDSFQLLSHNPYIPIVESKNKTIEGNTTGNVYNIHYNYVIKDLVINK